MSTKKFRALSQLECQVLYEIWRIEAYPGAHKATRKRLSQAVKIAPGYLAKILSGIRKISADDYLEPIRLHGQHGQQAKATKGPPQVYYQLIGRRLVTFQDTALLLLELVNFPRSMPRRVDRSQFIEAMTNRLNLDKSIVERKIQWAIDNGYVSADELGINIAPEERIEFERAYLELLAGRVALVQGA